VVRNLILLILFILTFCSPTFSFAKDKEEADRSRVRTIRFDDLQLSITEKNPNEGYLIQFLKDGRVIFTGECAFRVHEPKMVTATPRPNCRSLLVYCFSGGAHCCMTLIIATSCNSQKDLATVNLEHSGDEVKFVNADGGDAKELQVIDWQLAYYSPEDSELELPFADSPEMDRLLVFDGGKWRVDRVGEFRRYYEIRFGKSRDAALAAAKKGNDEERIAVRAMQAAYYSLMSGKSVEDAREVLNRLLPPSWKPESAKVIEDIRRAVAEYNPVVEIQ
jgi:hypothetical protein